MFPTIILLFGQFQLYLILNCINENNLKEILSDFRKELLIGRRRLHHNRRLALTKKISKKEIVLIFHS